MKTYRLILVGVIAASFAWTNLSAAPPAPSAADPNAHAAHAAQTRAADTAAQLAELRAKLARLEASFAGKSFGAIAPAPAANAMPGMSGMSGGSAQKSGMGEMGQMMGMMGKMMDMMGGMMGGMSGNAQSGGGMKGMGGMMDMDMMSMGNSGGMGGMMQMDAMEMGGMGGMQPRGMAGMSSGASMPMMDDMMGMGAMGAGPNMGASALPGFAGKSHLYHVGSTGFFLNHGQHITLTGDQTTRLNGIKEAAQLEKASADRAISQAEQELWVLTSADQPDAAKIEEKVRSIEKVQADQRLAFIRKVGEAAAVLDDHQRQILAGTAHQEQNKSQTSGGAKNAPADPHAGHAPAKP
jgi:hypothetical protein